MEFILSHKPRFTWVIRLILLIISIPLIASYVSTGYEIRDLQRNDDCFKFDANLWTASSLTSMSNKYSQCAGTYLLGGYDVLDSYLGSQANQYFSRTYNNIQSHTMVYFALSMFALDSWNGEPGFDISVGGTYFNGWTNFDYSNFAANYCGTSNNDQIDVRIFGRISHTGSSITFEIISRLDQQSDNESWGIRNLILLFATPSSSPGQAFCGRAGITIYVSDQCSAPPGQYWIDSVTFGLCHQNCLTCFGASPSDCYECKSGYGWNGVSCIQCDPSCTSCYGTANNQCGSCSSEYLLYQNTTCVKASDCKYPLLQTGCGSFCQSPCNNANDFAYWDQSCESYCNSPPYQQVTILSSKTCYYPCATSAYVYWDGTCSAVCKSPPLTTGTFKARNLCKYQCSTNYFLYWDGSCSATCVFPLTQGALDGNRFCFYPCLTANNYLYWDGTCSANCNAPLTQRTTMGKRFCDYKCLSTEYLRFDGVCVPTCTIPYIEREQWGQGFCDFPCPSTQPYLYWDNLCYATCPSPLIQSATAGKSFCNYQCALNKYLYWDGSCQSSCNLPFTKKFIADRSLCVYSCTAGEYLYQNGTCINNCLAPFTIRTQGGINYCDLLCPWQVLFWNGQCIRSCNTPLFYATNSSGTFCVDPCNDPTQYYYAETGECKSYCNTVSVFENELYLRCLPPDPEIKPVELVRLLHHLRYLNINFPPRLQEITISKSMNFLSMRMISSNLDEMRKWILRAVEIEEIGGDTGLVYSDFLANFLDELFLMGVIAVAGILFKILERISQLFDSFYFQIIFERLCVLCTWNLFLVLFTSTVGDIILYTSIQFKTFKADSIQDNISFMLCVLMFIAVLLLFIFNFYLVHRIKAFQTKALEKKTNTSFPDYLLKWQSCQVLFRGFNDSSILTSCFYMIYQLRIAVPMAIATILPSVPILQAVFYIIISFLIILFIFIKVPIKKHIDQINLLLLETLILLINICALILSIFDYYDGQSYGAYSFFGDIIIAGNFGINLLAGIMLPVKLISGVQYALLARKNNSSEEFGAWAQLFFLPLQQGGLGFEQVQIVTAFTVSRIKSANNKVSTIDLGGPVGPPMSELPNYQANESNIMNQTSSSLTNLFYSEKKQEFADADNENNNYEAPQTKKRKDENNEVATNQNFNVIEEREEEDQTLTNRVDDIVNLDESPVKINEVEEIHQKGLDRNTISLSNLVISDLKPDLHSFPEDNGESVLDMSQFKKRRQFSNINDENNIVRSSHNFSAIPESKEEEQSLTARIKSVSNLQMSQDIRQDIGVSGGPIKRRNLNRMSRNFASSPNLETPKNVSLENTEDPK